MVVLEVSTPLLTQVGMLTRRISSGNMESVGFVVHVLDTLLMQHQQSVVLPGAEEGYSLSAKGHDNTPDGLCETNAIAKD